MNFSTRPYAVSDRDAVHHVFYEAVQTGAVRFYSAAQRQAWAGSPTAAPDAWQKLRGMITWVAEADDRIIGFFGLEPDGHLDLAFVAPAWMGKGVSDALYARILTEANTRNLARLWTEASHLARSFFIRHGWCVITAETVARHGQKLERFQMELMLGDHS